MVICPSVVEYMARALEHDPAGQSIQDGRIAWRAKAKRIQRGGLSATAAHVVITLRIKLYAGSVTHNSRRTLAGWPMFFRTWGTRICSSQSVGNIDASRSKNPRGPLAIDW